MFTCAHPCIDTRAGSLRICVHVQPVYLCIPVHSTVVQEHPCLRPVHVRAVPCVLHVGMARKRMCVYAKGFVCMRGYCIYSAWLIRYCNSYNSMLRINMKSLQILEWTASNNMFGFMLA